MTNRFRLLTDTGVSENMSESAENLDSGGFALVKHRDSGRMLDGDLTFRPFSVRVVVVISLKESEPDLGLVAESHSKWVVTRSSMACVIARKLSMIRDVAIEVVERMMGQNTAGMLMRGSSVKNDPTAVTVTEENTIK